MLNFSYKAKDKLGRYIEGFKEASDEDDLSRKLKEDGQYLITASLKKSSPKTIKTISASIKKRDLITFTNHLAAAFSAGAPIIQALQDFEKGVRDSAFKKVIRDIGDKVRGGMSLSDAFSEYPRIFSRMYVNVVRVGETAGTIEVLFDNLASFMEWQVKLEGDARKLLTYPALVLTAISAIIIALVTFVYPKIAVIFTQASGTKGSGTQMPKMTMLVLSLSNLIRNHWPFLVLIVLAIGISYSLLKMYPGGELFIDSLKLRIPLIGEFLKKIAISRFVNYLEVLQRAGIDLPQSLQVAGESVGNRVLMMKILKAREKVIAGRSLSESLLETGFFPDLIIRMIMVGETSGNIEDNLHKVCQYYEREIPTVIQRTFAVIEPLMILCLAGAVLFIALSMYLPIYKLYGTLSAK